MHRSYVVWETHSDLSTLLFFSYCIVGFTDKSTDHFKNG